jgi:hypothetical protein
MTTNRTGRRTSGREYSFALRLAGSFIKQEAAMTVVLMILLILMEIFGLGDFASSIWNFVLPLLLKVMITTVILIGGVAFIESLNPD